MDAFTIERQTLEPHQLERRFATLRLPEPKRLAALERSLAHAGQLQPLIALPTDGPTSGSAPFVLLDGYRRLEALGRLERDTAQVAIWHCPVADALPRVLAQGHARAWAPVEEALMLRALATDELGYLTLKPEQTNAFFKLMDQRYGRVSTIITTNLDYEAWYDMFEKKPLVDALLERLQHHCITIRIDGPSLRVPTPPPDKPQRSGKKTTSKRS